jgi:hypothetical protein
LIPRHLMISVRQIAYVNFGCSNLFHSRLSPSLAGHASRSPMSQDFVNYTVP